MRISDWSSDVCSSDLVAAYGRSGAEGAGRRPRRQGLPGREAGDRALFRRALHARRRRAPPQDRGGQRGDDGADPRAVFRRSEENTSELQSLMRISYAIICLKKKNAKIRE